MLDCRHCGEYLRGDVTRFGSRCPRCREPLYERLDAVRRQRDAHESRGGICAVHPGNIAIGPCPRCGTFMCGLCRTRWDNRTLCLACVERLMSGLERSPEDARTHRRLALAGLLLGILAWLLTLPVVVVRGVGSVREVLIALLILAMMSLIPALIGLGQAVSAIRMRGDRMVLATFALVLAGSQVGTVTGLLLLVIWKQ
jgi:hypothetical protein